MAGNEDEPDVGGGKPRKGEPAPIPTREELSEEQRERLKERRHAAGLAREKAGREGRNDPYVGPENPYAPHPQHEHHGGESKQAHGDAASGPDRTPDVSRGHRKHDPGRSQ